MANPTLIKESGPTEVVGKKGSFESPEEPHLGARKISTAMSARVVFLVQRIADRPSETKALETCHSF
jgi:hypothetical protein